MHAFYCPYVLDISQIIKSQTDLQILGLYFSRLSSPLKTLKKLHDAQFYLPIVLTFDSLSFSSIPDGIKIFPDLYSVDRRATISQALAQSICKGRSNCMVIKADNIVHLSIYMIDSSDMPYVYALAKEVAEIFPRIHWLYLWFERGPKIVSLILTVDDYITVPVLKDTLYSDCRT